jgi:hypothetical protein
MRRPKINTHKLLNFIQFLPIRKINRVQPAHLLKSEIYASEAWIILQEPLMHDLGVGYTIYYAIDKVQQASTRAGGLTHARAYAYDGRYGAIWVFLTCLPDGF